MSSLARLSQSEVVKLSSSSLLFYNLRSSSNSGVEYCDSNWRGSQRIDGRCENIDGWVGRGGARIMLL